MSIVSFYFFVFLFISVICYYIFPKNKRWIVLLLSSLIFFLLASSWKMIFYLLFGIITTYFGTRYMHEKCKTNQKKKVVLILTLFSIVSELFVLKYINIFPLVANTFSSLFSLNLSFKTISLLAPIGISYYTLSLIGYVVDVYRTTCEPQKNIFKHALFACYYPIMVSGPNVRYSTMEKELFQKNEFEWNNLYLGFYRIVFGLMKKLIIANQLALIVSAVFSNYKLYSGYYIVLGLICYAIQIYADFSGCMDIVIGASKMYGIELPENFRSPFFSRNLSEFWRRWHISLGTWAKDYIMYPLLKSSCFQKLNEVSKSKLGKKLGKKIPTILAILILWLLIGLWHGASYRYIFAAGILPWIYLTLSQLFEDVFKKVNDKLHFNVTCFSFHLLQSLRTLGFMCLIWLFVCAPRLSESFDVIKSIFVLPAESIYSLLPVIPIKIVSILLILVIIVDYLNYKDINAFEKFRNQNLWFRWFVLLILLSIIFLPILPETPPARSTPPAGRLAPGTAARPVRTSRPPGRTRPAMPLAACPAGGSTPTSSGIPPTTPNLQPAPHSTTSSAEQTTAPARAQPTPAAKPAPVRCRKTSAPPSPQTPAPPQAPGASYLRIPRKYLRNERWQNARNSSTSIPNRPPI
jgi:D-alanyl-lipoteichoic acid acyltransferase DltB (MBOAT superfamily)